jgi:putative hydrolase of the HAD superfamily
MPLRGAFFDLYGTLLCYGNVQAAWTDWLNAFHEGLIPHGLRMSPAEFPMLCDGFFTKPEPQRRNSAFTIYDARVDALCHELGLEVPPGDISRIADMAASAWHRHLHLDPDCHAVMAELRMRYKLALISNFDHPPYAERLLANLGLTDYFAAVIISGAVGVKKPHPGIFRIALERTELDANQVVHVGDTDEDVIGASAAGIQPILIARDSRPAQAAALDFRADADSSNASESRLADSLQVLTIRSLSELLTVLPNHSE